MHSSLFFIIFSSSFFNRFRHHFVYRFFSFFFIFSCFSFSVFFHLFIIFVFTLRFFKYWLHCFFLYPQTIPRPNGSKLVLPLFHLCFPFWSWRQAWPDYGRPEGSPKEVKMRSMARLGLGLGKARREPQGGQNEELLG